MEDTWGVIVQQDYGTCSLLSSRIALGLDVVVEYR